MKLLPVIVAVSKAQVDVPDLSRFGLGSGTPLDFPGSGPSFNFADGAGNEERYFFTTTTTTSTTTTTTTTTSINFGDTCWKCDQKTYANCALDGEFETCEMGVEDCCFVEIREQNQKLAQLSTGCKDEQACLDNKNQNFIGDFNTVQCRPDYQLQRRGARNQYVQSVCRQCFNTCTISGPAENRSECFGSIQDASTAVNVHFSLDSNRGNMPWSVHYHGSDIHGFGIPTYGITDGAVDFHIISEITNFQPDTLNLWFRDVTGGATDGKIYEGSGDSTRDAATEMTYWGLQGASMAWWSNDLKQIQLHLNSLKYTITGLTVIDFNI